MHARALYDPVFQAKLAVAARTAGPDTVAFCERCHSPLGNMLGDPNGTTHIEAAEGVTCMFCHQVVGDTGAHGNTSQLVVTDLTRRAQIEKPVAPHPAMLSSFSRTSAFCGACHEVVNASGLRIDSTYSEWAGSSYAKNGVQCQDCHMSAVPGVPGPSTQRAAPFGPPRPGMYQMSFVGANVGQGPADASRAMLRSAATVRIDMPEVIAPGRTASATVTITNTGAGHDLPTGLTEERQMWLEVFSEDIDGTSTKLGEVRFGTVFQDALGRHPAEIWDATSIYSDRRIPPGGSATSVYSFKMPADAQQETVVAALYYRSLSDALAADAQVPNPTTTMAEATQTIYASTELRDALKIETTGSGQAPSANIWTLLSFALLFGAATGAVSIGIVTVQKL